MTDFSDEERVRIEEQLIEIDRELLRLYGPKKTNVEDNTGPMGIAKSSFYLFFDSKAELYVKIIERESEEFLAEVEEALAGVDAPRDALEELFWCDVEFAGTNPLAQYRDSLLHSIPSELMERSGLKQMADYVPIIESLQERSGSPRR